MKYLLDTNVCIEAMRGNRAVVQRLEMVSPGECFLSTISLFELEAGAFCSRNPKVEHKKVRLLADTLLLKDFDCAASMEAAKVRSDLESLGKRIGAYDTFLAGHALALSVPLVTNNTREFGRIFGLELENWETV